MAVVVNSIRIMLEIVQHGVQHAGNVISPTIGKSYMAKFLHGDKIKTEAGNLVRVSPWLMKLEIPQPPLVHRIP